MQRGCNKNKKAFCISVLHNLFTKTIIIMENGETMEKE
ncbi:hypothetical protein NT01EI_3779 [Edwardsiella ictaluri 93-146]|uniref:Uncharacterized protein n=1 Tax=Edwardsiella ictaluri (strain 93-146) TaxID=634503 RepID=C5BB62_EDWI9|nr:hypothetical protein NT01EI_3779 [Edwardsiella ictaluri 93-146]